MREGHTAQECKTAKVDQSKRLCFDCNLPGHQARNCPSKSKVPVKAIEDGDVAANALDIWGLCLTSEPEPKVHTCSEGFTRVGRPVIPKPIGSIMGEIIDAAFKNKFQVLSEVDDVKKKKKKQKVSNSSKDMSPSESVCNLVPNVVFSQTAFEVDGSSLGTQGFHGSEP